MRREELRGLWADVAQHGFELPAVTFYGHTSGPNRAFSNFFEHAPFEFVVPECCGVAELKAAGRATAHQVEFSEKAIMLCKATLMGDYFTFDAISRASSPKEAKELGRLVAPWKQSRWDAAILEVAREVVLQKARALPQVAELLRATGSRVIAESTRNDAIWGTGRDAGHRDASNPSRWPGTNVLGWALMVARAQLAEDDARAQLAVLHAEDDAQEGAGPGGATGVAAGVGAAGEQRTGA